MLVGEKGEVLQGVEEGEEGEGQGEEQVVEDEGAVCEFATLPRICIQEHIVYCCDVVKDYPLTYCKRY